MIKVDSTIKLDYPEIEKLTAAATEALIQTAYALQTEVVQAQVMPFDDPTVIEKRVYGKKGQFAKNGREYKGKIQKELIHGGGHLQNDSTFVNFSKAKQGSVSLVSHTPYARRLYFHPEYHFDKGENPHARGKWYEDWISGRKKTFCQDAFTEIYRRLTGL